MRLIVSTPLTRGEKSTARRFGDFIHKYPMRQAVAADGRGRIKPGAYSVEAGVPAEPFIDEIRKRFGTEARNATR